MFYTAGRKWGSIIPHPRENTEFCIVYRTSVQPRDWNRQLGCIACYCYLRWNPIFSSFRFDCLRFCSKNRRIEKFTSDKQHHPSKNRWGGGHLMCDPTVASQGGSLSEVGWCGGWFSCLPRAPRWLPWHLWSCWFLTSEQAELLFPHQISSPSLPYSSASTLIFSPLMLASSAFYAVQHSAHAYWEDGRSCKTSKTVEESPRIIES